MQKVFSFTGAKKIVFGCGALRQLVQLVQALQLAFLGACALGAAAQRLAELGEQARAQRGKIFFKYVFMLISFSGYCYQKAILFLRAVYPHAAMRAEKSHDN